MENSSIACLGGIPVEKGKAGNGFRMGKILHDQKRNAMIAPKLTMVFWRAATQKMSRLLRGALPSGHGHRSVTGQCKASPAKGQGGATRKGETYRYNRVRVSLRYFSEKNVLLPGKPFLFPYQTGRMKVKAERRFSPSFSLMPDGICPIRRRRKSPSQNRISWEALFSLRPWHKFHPCLCPRAFCHAGQRACCSWCSNP